MAFLWKPYSRSQTREVKVYHRKTIWLLMQRHQILREKIEHQHKFSKYQQFMLSYLARWIHNCIYAYMYKHLPVQGQSPPGHHPPGQSPPGQSPPDNPHPDNPHPDNPNLGAAKNVRSIKEIIIFNAFSWMQFLNRNKNFTGVCS